jgi:ZIP family zinc transporter
MLLNLAQYPLPLVATVGSLASAMATTLGAVPILFTKRVSLKMQDCMMGFGAGVMLAATSFSLIIPGLAAASIYAGKYGSSLIVALGMILGAMFLFICDKYAPHEYFFGNEGAIQFNDLKRVWLFVLAITIHNFPEGLAVGVGFGSESLSEAIPIAVGIGLQNMPEGLVVALALITQKYTRGYAFLVAFLTGMVEPIGSLIGFIAVSLMKALLPWGLAFAAGAMLYVITNEIIPESQARGFKREATASLMVGFILMMFLDVALG